MRKYRIRTGSLAEVAVLAAAFLLPYMLSLIVILLILKGF